MVSEKRIYTVATAHLDTVWNWDFEYTIGVCLYNTLADNFRLFSMYPDYKFNFEGSYRYELMEEYYPELFEKLKGYVEQGRWNVAGSCYENGDVNVPSPEAMFRNILYGNGYFKKTFGKTSSDIFLPDCFGFGWALPSIAEHGNLKGFTTQKLTWGSAYGVPFDLGRWQGVNGKWIFASLDPKSYTSTLKKVRKNSDLTDKLKMNTKKYDLPWTFAFHGTGDVGGAPKEESVRTVCTEIAANATEQVKVLSTKADQIYDDLAALSDDHIYKLPVWNNELLMTNHGPGSYTSRTFSKRCNRRNEELADLAERACVAAEYVTGAPYPKHELEKAWKRNIAHTFHDDITGTSLQRVYQRSWNDYIMSSNQFVNAYEGAASEIAKQLNTSWVQGVPLVVNNHIEVDRRGAVNATIANLGTPYIKVYDSFGDEVPSQVTYLDENMMQIVFIATVPGLGYRVYDVRPSNEPCSLKTDVRASISSLENDKYIVRINKNGDIYSIIDKTLANKELLDKPIRYCINLDAGDKKYPAWELKYKEVKRPSWEFAEYGECDLIENGAARVTIKVTQRSERSTFTYFVSLTAGGEWVEVFNEIEWRDRGCMLKNNFSFTAKSKEATFDLGLGAIRRGNRTKKLFEVPAQRWADISDDKEFYGVSVFSDSKYGWDKPNNNTIRLTAIHTPKRNFREESMQSMMDLGLNRYGYAIYSHHGGYDKGTQFGARCFNQPMTAIVTDVHVGSLSDIYSFGTINNEDVIIRAIKKAEDSDTIIVRFNEGANKHAENVRAYFGTGVESAVEVYASEEYKGEAVVDNGRLVFDLEPYEVKTFAIKLYSGRLGDSQKQIVVDLPHNIDVVTFNNNRRKTIIPTLGVSIPGEIFPAWLTCGGVTFKTAELGDEMNNALICDGQTIAVNGTRLYFVAASLAGDQPATFYVDDAPVEVVVQAINERIGGWDLYDLGETAFVKTDKLAWEFTHTHSPEADNIANQLFFFRYELNITGASTVTLPQGNNIIMLAATATDDTSDAVLVTDLYDKIEKRPFTYTLKGRDKRKYKKELKRVAKKNKKK